MAERRVGPYVLERELGRGNYGAVYLAHHTDLQRPVALKVLIATGDPTIEARFEREARVASRLSHPAIVGCFDVGRDDRRDARYLAMDYVEGRTLKQRLKEGPLEVAEAYSLASEIAGALAHAHQNGVVHRDLKPDNILLDPQGRPHVTDFGLARDLADGAGMLTAAGHMIGTPDYMAPEQTTGEPVDARVDVYALGAILYQCLTGKKPFRGDRLEHLVHQIRLGKPERPAKLRPEIPFALEDVVLHAMTRDPQDRYADGAALAAALAEVDPSTLSTSAVQWAAKHSHALLIGAGVALGALIGVVLLVVLRGAPEEAASPTAAVIATPSTPAPVTPTRSTSPVPAPTPTRTTPAPERSRASLEALDDAALEAYQAGHPAELEPYLVLARRKIKTWSFSAAEALLARARDEARGDRKRARLEVVGSRIAGERADERRLVKAARRRYQSALDAQGALAQVRKLFAKHPGSLMVRRELFVLHGVTGNYSASKRHLQAAARHPQATDRDRRNLEAFSELAQLAKPVDPERAPKGWLPLDGGQWTLAPDGTLMGSLPGIGMFGFCGRLAEACPVLEGPRVISVEMKFKSGEQNAFGGIMFAVESVGTMMIAYPFQAADELKRLRKLTGEKWEKGFRLALFRRGEWQHLDTQSVTFGDDWFKLELRITETGVIPVLDGKTLRRVPIPSLPRGRVGVMKFYSTTACFRNLRWK